MTNVVPTLQGRHWGRLARAGKSRPLLRNRNLKIDILIILFVVVTAIKLEHRCEKFGIDGFLIRPSKWIHA